MKKLPIVLAVAALVVLGGFYYLSQEGHAEDSAAAAQGSAPPPQAVSVMSLKLEKVTFTQQLPGRVSPFRQSQVRPQVDGIITERLFDEGADVEKGQQLYQIDDARYKAALNSAIADLNSAKSSVKAVEAKAKRYEDLVGINAVSQQEYDDVKAEYDQAKAAIAVAQAAVDLAQVNLDYTKVYAPIAGRISRSFVTEGALVTANQSQNLATITQLDPVYIDMQQAGAEAMQLRTRVMDKASVPVSVILNEKTGEMYDHEGSLKFSEVTVDETTGSITLRALVDNPDDVLLPGLFVRTVMKLGEEEVLLVPQRATTRAADGNLSAWIVDADGKAQPRSIQVLRAFEDSWVVTSGLEAGDKVIVEGYQKVAAGAAVSETEWQKNKDEKSVSGGKE
ncbi:MAG TPA: efflux RND transporter periplasmic adaptor subunit [Micavibrio sp.]|nr:efflux RND transporter periplasmic adaptor subunit [Micavibrio sp.]HIL28693.1 efflux RND transporter periplasmic adaptor subunit [Micavibrio sp.]